ncbi:hypothetical protein C9374_008420 [Naegleria lovaniensis]|uniref:Uncharacterized protein n=1 Tax=Naegleria lovaniensis TaxID=51637 RepID=A0AA88GF35_NAELO|nr:uncharacterized protein C9374_008420 [Naegleria lovaniensis]KAG2378277.1 hypothetical protein C9374_008420 [Naegleria lovaniensis]
MIKQVFTSSKPISNFVIPPTQPFLHDEDHEEENDHVNHDEEHISGDFLIHSPGVNSAGELFSITQAHTPLRSGSWSNKSSRRNSQNVMVPTTPLPLKPQSVNDNSSAVQEQQQQQQLGTESAHSTTSSATITAQPKSGGGDSLLRHESSSLDMLQELHDPRSRSNSALSNYTMSTPQHSNNVLSTTQPLMFESSGVENDDHVFHSEQDFEDTDEQYADPCEELDDSYEIQRVSHYTNSEAIIHDVFDVNTKETLEQVITQLNHAEEELDREEEILHPTSSSTQHDETMFTIPDPPSQSNIQSKLVHYLKYLSHSVENVRIQSVQGMKQVLTCVFSSGCLKSKLLDDLYYSIVETLTMTIQLFKSQSKYLNREIISLFHLLSNYCTRQTIHSMIDVLRDKKLFELYDSVITLFFKIGDRAIRMILDHLENDTEWNNIIITHIVNHPLIVENVVIPILCKECLSFDIDKRTCAVRAIKHLGMIANSALPTLVNMLMEGHANRILIGEAIRAMGDEGEKTLLSIMNQCHVFKVREAILTVLGQLPYCVNSNLTILANSDIHCYIPSPTPRIFYYYAGDASKELPPFLLFDSKELIALTRQFLNDHPNSIAMNSRDKHRMTSSNNNTMNSSSNNNMNNNINGNNTMNSNHINQTTKDSLEYICKPEMTLLYAMACSMKSIIYNNHQSSRPNLSGSRSHPTSIILNISSILGNSMNHSSLSTYQPNASGNSNCNSTFMNSDQLNNSFSILKSYYLKERKRVKRMNHSFTSHRVVNSNHHHHDGWSDHTRCVCTIEKTEITNISPECVHCLIHNVQYPEESVRYASVKSIESIISVQVPCFLQVLDVLKKEALMDSSHRVRASALQALAKIGTEMTQKKSRQHDSTTCWRRENSSMFGKSLDSIEGDDNHNTIDDDFDDWKNESSSNKNPTSLEESFRHCRMSGVHNSTSSNNSNCTSNNSTSSNNCTSNNNTTRNNSNNTTRNNNSTSNSTSNTSNQLILSKHEKRNLLSKILPLLKDTHWNVRMAACHAMSCHHVHILQMSNFDKEFYKLIFHYLIGVLKDGSISRNEVSKCLSLLEYDGISQLIYLLRQDVQSMNIQVRISCAYGLSLIDLESPYIDRIIESLFMTCSCTIKTPPLVRRAAIKALGALSKKSHNKLTYLGPRTLLPFLYGFLKDRQVGVRQMASQVLAQSGPYGELLLMEGLLKDSNHLIRASAAMGMIHLGPKTIITILLALSNEYHPQICQHLFECIESFKLDDMIDVIMGDSNESLNAIDGHYESNNSRSSRSSSRSSSSSNSSNNHSMNSSVNVSSSISQNIESIANAIRDILSRFVSSAHLKQHSKHVVRSVNNQNVGSHVLVASPQALQILEELLQTIERRRKRNC